MAAKQARSMGRTIIMYLQRKIDQFLVDWKKKDHKPLVISGARQVGKTESILKFAKENYKNFVYINFVEEPIYKMIPLDNFQPESIIRNITRIDPSKRFIPGETLIILDEVQEFPAIATALKFFKLDGRYDIILSGSLLGIQYHRLESVSVGYKEDYEMVSMDFEEFLWAKGYGHEFIQSILAHMINGQPFDALDMKLLQDLFLDYCTLGGMPEIVRTYIERGTFEGTLELQRQLIRDYEGDIRKYLNGLEQTRVLAVFHQIPIQLAQENKKFQITRISKNARLKNYIDAIEWLKEAGIIRLCHCLHYPSLPLKGNQEENKFKIYFSDTGLLIASLDDEAQMDFRGNRNMGIYKGALYENVVSEALAKSGFPLYYYKRNDSTLEEDFFIRTTDELLPVEVKARNGTAKSLKTLIKSSAYPDIRHGIKLVHGNIGQEGGIYTYPYFCTFLLKSMIREISSKNK